MWGDQDRLDGRSIRQSFHGRRVYGHGVPAVQAEVAVPPQAYKPDAGGNFRNGAGWFDFRVWNIHLMRKSRGNAG
jgi:hypothetical protein